VVDVRIVAATNKDLSRGIAEGWFREDLYARLKGLVVTLPALRERVDDLSCLADHFLKQAAQQTHRQVPSLTNDAVAALRRYYWPHNVRELAQCLVQAVALSDAPLLHAEDLRLPDTKPAPAPPCRPAPTPEASGDTAVLECLRRHGFDMQAAARSLGWDRSTVTQRLKGLCFQTLVDTQGDKAKAAMILAQDPALVRTVELKLLEYMEHLVTVLSAYRTASEAIAGCRKRFKNLPDRHFKAVEILIARQFDLTRKALPG
jgi:transcriptional regulator with AAA-type ATPase domain